MKLFCGLSRFVLVTLMAVSLALPVWAAPQAVPERTTTAEGTSGLPIPRFVTTRSEAVNLRSGPGERYPVQWVLRKKGMPVEIIAEYENWRKIRDWLGTEGWVHQALLSGKRMIVIYPADGVLREEPNPIARPVARLQEGVIGKVSDCTAEWCRFTVQDQSGWVNRQSLWGLYPSEMIE